MIITGRIQIVLEEKNEKWLRSQIEGKGDLSRIMNCAIGALKKFINDSGVKPWRLQITKDICAPVFMFQDAYVADARKHVEDVVNTMLRSKGISDYEFKFEEVKTK